MGLTYTVEDGKQVTKYRGLNRVSNLSEVNPGALVLLVFNTFEASTDLWLVEDKDGNWAPARRELERYYREQQDQSIDCMGHTRYLHNRLMKVLG